MGAACDFLDDLPTQEYLSEPLRVAAPSSATPFLEELYSSEPLLPRRELMDMEVTFACVNQMGHPKPLMLYYAHNKKLSPGDFCHPEINFRHLPPGRIKLSQTFATLPSLFKLSSRRTFG